MVPRQGRTRRVVAIAAVLAVLASLSLARVATRATGKAGERTDAVVSAHSLREALRSKAVVDALTEPTIWREDDAADVVVGIVDEEVKVEESPANRHGGRVLTSSRSLQNDDDLPSTEDSDSDGDAVKDDSVGESDL